MATGSFEPVAAPQAAPPRLVVPRTPTLQQHAHAQHEQVPASPRPASAPPGMIPPPPPQHATGHATGNERAWTQAWEDAQALARTNLPGYVQPQQHLVAAPPQAQHVRRVAHQRVDGPTYRDFPPPAAREAYGEAAVLPPAAAMQELRAAHAAVAREAYDVDDFELEQPSATPDIKRLALRSVIPGIALFGAVLMGRVLLSSPAPAPTPAPTAEVAPAHTAPALTPEPAPVEPAPTAAAPAASERRSKATRSSARSRATQDDMSGSSDIAASAPRATRTREVFDTEPAARSTKSEKVEKADDAAPAAAAAERGATSGIGILRLNSRPWSQVFVDGKSVGNTPQMGLRLRAGKHQIELVNPQLGMSKKFQVTVAADEIVTRAEMLEE
jgi:hypothetical protein